MTVASMQAPAVPDAISKAVLSNDSSFRANMSSRHQALLLRKSFWRKVVLIAPGEEPCIASLVMYLVMQESSPGAIQTTFPRTQGTCTWWGISLFQPRRTVTTCLQFVGCSFQQTATTCRAKCRQAPHTGLYVRQKPVAVRALRSTSNPHTMLHTPCSSMLFRSYPGLPKALH